MELSSFAVTPTRCDISTTSCLNMQFYSLRAYLQSNRSFKKQIPGLPARTSKILLQIAYFSSAYRPQMSTISLSTSLQVSTCFPTGTVHLSPKHHSGARLKVLQKLHVFASSPQNLQFSHRLQVSTISLSTEFWTFELGIRLEIGS